LRLARFGRKHKPTYRIVAADSRSPRDGRHIEQVGSYDPIPRKDKNGDPFKEIRLKAERVKYWLSVGAQPSDRVKKILAMADLIPEAPQRQLSIRHVPKAGREEHLEKLKAEGNSPGGARAFSTSARSESSLPGEEGAVGFGGSLLVGGALPALPLLWAPAGPRVMGLPWRGIR